MDLDQWIVTVGSALAALMALATLITGLTKTPADDAIVGKINYVFARLFGWSTFKDAGGTFKLPLQKPNPPVKQ